MGLFNRSSGGLLGSLQTANVNGLTGKSTAGVANAQPVKGRFLVTQTASLGASPAAQPTFQIPNFNGLPLNCLKFVVTATIVDTTTTATILPLESVIKQFQLTDNVGNILMQLDGTKNDISLTARLFSNNGQYQPAPLLTNTTSSSLTPGTYTSSWIIEYPFSVPAGAFPLNMNLIFSDLASLATADSSGITSGTATLTVYGDYVAHSFTYAKLRSIDIPVPGTGTITLNTFYDQLANYLLQAYQYGADANISASGNGITFSTDGSLQQLNVPLGSYIQEENLAYPNSVASGSGHVEGFVNLFSPTFTQTAASQLQINFTSAPGLLNGNYTDEVRSYWVERL